MDRDKQPGVEVPPRRPRGLRPERINYLSQPENLQGLIKNSDSKGQEG